MISEAWIQNLDVSSLTWLEAERAASWVIRLAWARLSLGQLLPLITSRWAVKLFSCSSQTACMPPWSAAGFSEVDTMYIVFRAPTSFV